MNEAPTIETKEKKEGLEEFKLELGNFWAQNDSVGFVGLLTLPLNTLT